MTFDMELGYQVIDNIEVIAGARNVFDSFPTDNPFSGVAGASYPVTARVALMADPTTSK